jgi:3',5'-cyclic AMP phosphodiesterase CpdA
VYGHLHIPRTTWYDGVRFEEVSVGYPREWRRRKPYTWLRQVLPEPRYAPGYLNDFGGHFVVTPEMRRQAEQFRERLRQRQSR